MSGSFNPPANPTVGQIYTFGGATWRWDGTAWVNASTGANFVATTGSTMTGPLVLSGNAPASAPLQAVPLQQVSTPIAAAPNNVGRNIFHNAVDAVLQRGLGPWTASGYMSDRWQSGITGSDSASFSVVNLTDADRAAIGDEDAINALQVTVTGSAAGSSYTLFQQPVEYLSRLSGKTVTLSFYAIATSGTPKLGINAFLQYGSGGSAAAWAFPTGYSVTISNVWARYSVAFTLPTASGKTIGSSSNTQIVIWLSSAPGNAALSGNIGVQAATIRFWARQLEYGSGPGFPTPVEKLDLPTDVGNCQRFFQAGVAAYSNGYNTAGNGLALAIGLPVTMRANPTMVQTGAANTNFTFSSVSATNPSMITVSGTSPASSGYFVFMTFNASADL